MMNFMIFTASVRNILHTTTFTTHLMSVPQVVTVMCSLCTLNYNMAQTFQKVLTEATEIPIPYFGMINTTNIIFSFNGCVPKPAVLWHKSAQSMVTPIVQQDGSRLI
jgi:hypothetical protein